MRKITKTLFITLLTLIMCFNATSIGASAAVQPRLSAIISFDLSFSTTDTGGTVVVKYDGYDANFEKIDVSVKLQKRFLLVFWSDVDEWNVSSTNPNALLTHVFTLNGTGTYKATFTINATSKDGNVDNIVETIESKY